MNLKDVLKREAEQIRANPNYVAEAWAQAEIDLAPFEAELADLLAQCKEHEAQYDQLRIRKDRG